MNDRLSKYSKATDCIYQCEAVLYALGLDGTKAHFLLGQVAGELANELQRELREHKDDAKNTDLLEPDV